ncbi:hypothetical protein [Formosa haliotis]|uniref:hypothetical protein n=1 Tax=Formosa haliotis TaxID=1555194 RepID=UPI0008248130|nr:hypothetical protein [Formosa haliotis]
MKNIKLILPILCVLLGFSCSDDDYVEYTAPDDLSDVSWIISIDKFAVNPFSVNIDTFMSFFDLSQGTVSHEWQIEEGNHFLKSGFAPNDTLANFIDEAAGLKIDTEKAHVLFNNPGINKVRLLNKFKHPVSYNGKDGKIEAVQEGDLWVIDTSFVFDVYENIKPAFKVFQNDAVVLDVLADDMPLLKDSLSWPEVEVEAGGELVFEDATTVGRPNARSWVVPHGTPAQTGGVTAVIKFYKLGTYNAGSMKSSRINELPKYNTEKLIPLRVKVIQSTQPFVFDGNLKELENETITFRVNGEIAPFTGQEQNFQVHVVNSVSGFDQIVPVHSAKVSSNSTIMELKLTQPIYNSDEITVTYTSDGGIQSLDQRTLQSFGPETVSMHIGNNILKSGSWASYEIYMDALNRGYLGPNGAFWVGANNTAQDPNWSRTEERASNGLASVKLSVEELSKNFQLFSYGLGTIDLVEAGTYEVSYMVYLDPNSSITAFRTYGDIVPEFGQSWDLSGVTKGQWTQVKQIITVPAITEKLKLTLLVSPDDNPGAGVGRQTIYFDDFALKVVEVRP